jgi:hypothetical protein
MRTFPAGASAARFAATHRIRAAGFAASDVDRASAHARAALRSTLHPGCLAASAIPGISG